MLVDDCLTKRTIGIWPTFYLRVHIFPSYQTTAVLQVADHWPLAVSLGGRELHPDSNGRGTGEQGPWAGVLTSYLYKFEYDYE